MPRRPAADDERVEAGRAGGAKRSGCQPRRYSSPAVAFCVQPMWRRLVAPWRCRRCSRCTRGSRRRGPRRSCAAGRGRRSTAARRRSGPTRRCAMISAIRSGSVSRPRRRSAWPSPRARAPSTRAASPRAKKRDGPESFDHSAIEPMCDVPEVDEVVGEAHELQALVELDARARPSRRRRRGRRSRSRRRRRRARPRASRARSARGSRASRRTRRVRGCSAARGTAPAGTCARRRRRRCRSRRCASARRRSTQSSCMRRMSRLVMARGTRPVAKSLAIWEGAAAGSRDSLFSPCAPVCESSMPASAPCACASSHVAASTRTSRSSHIRAETYGVSSDVRVDRCSTRCRRRPSRPRP